MSNIETWSTDTVLKIRKIFMEKVCGKCAAKTSCIISVLLKYLTDSLIT